MYTQPNVQLQRLVRQGVVRPAAHRFYYAPPDDKPDTWVPTLEAVAAGIATAIFDERVPVLMHLSAARLLEALPRAIGRAFVAAPRQHHPVQLDDDVHRGATVVVVARDVDALDALLQPTVLGEVLVTTPERRSWTSANAPSSALRRMSAGPLSRHSGRAAIKRS